MTAHYSPLKRLKSLVLALFAGALAVAGCGKNPAASDPVVVVASVAGDQQQGVFADTLAQPLVVAVTDEIGTPLPGYQVDFSVVQGDARLLNYTGLSDSLGRASTRLILGRRKGDIQVRAEILGVEPYAMFSATAAPLSYGGDFFLLVAGHKWDYSGDSAASLSMRLYGNIAGQRVDGSYSEPVSGRVVSTTEILPAQTVDLPSGIYSLFPQRTTSRFLGERDVSVSYLEKSGDSVFIRAIEADGRLVEIDDSQFIKSPLVEGDRWESYPEFDMDVLTNSIEGVRDAKIGIQASTRVVGKRQVRVMGETLEAIRLDQETNGKGTVFTTDIDMDLSFSMSTTLYLVENVGVVAEEQEVSMHVEGTIAEDWDRLTLEMDISGPTSLSLTSYPAQLPPLAKRSAKIGAASQGAVERYMQLADQVVRVASSAVF